MNVTPMTTPMTMDLWLQKTIPYDSSYHIKDVLNEMVQWIRIMVDSTEELQFDYEINTFKEKWYSFIYQRYYLRKPTDFDPYDSELYQYFGSKFSDELYSVATDIQEITHRYSIKHWISMDSLSDILVDIQEFLFDVLLIQDPFIDSDEETLHEDEENLIYSIDGHSV